MTTLVTLIFFTMILLIIALLGTIVALMFALYTRE